MSLAANLDAQVQLLEAQLRVLRSLAQEAAVLERDRGAGAGDPLMNDRDIAADLKIHPSDVCKLRRKGLFGDVIYLGPRCPRVRRSQVERFKEVAALKRIVA